MGVDGVITAMEYRERKRRREYLAEKLKVIQRNEEAVKREMRDIDKALDKKRRREADDKA